MIADVYVLGIDVGGTKSVCVLADESGRVLSTGRSRGANLHAAGPIALEKAIQRVIQACLASPPAASSVQPSAVALGIAGVDRAHEAEMVHAIMGRLGYTSGVVVVNDALIALVAEAGDEPGIVIIAGTGSMAYGRNRQDVAARAGGWGYLIGDEGSRYWIGREALTAVTHMLDGRGPLTSLTPAVLDHFKITDPSELPRIVYDRDLPRMNVSALGPVVQAARDAGDAVAIQILDRAADELTRAAASVARTLNLRDEAFRFVLAGGAFEAVPWLLEALPPRLASIAPNSRVVRLEAEPAIGAMKLALAEAKGGARLPRYR